MFFRVKRTGPYRYLQVVENRREGRRTVQRIVGSLGRVERLADTGAIETLLGSLARFAQEAQAGEYRAAAQPNKDGWTRLSAKPIHGVVAGRGPQEPVILRDRVYARIREALMTGKFLPGDKVTIRSLAGALGTSLTPVRDALGRLVAEGALEGEPNRSVRVPLMTASKLAELRDIRIAVEGLAAAKAAEAITAGEIAQLKRVAAEVIAARDRGDTPTDIAKVVEFQFLAYRASRMPQLLRIIEGLWLQTGPYINLLFPNYLRIRSGEWREKLCRCFEERDAVGARMEIEDDVRQALTYLCTLADALGLITPHGASRRGRAPDGVLEPVRRSTRAVGGSSRNRGRSATPTRSGSRR